MRRAARVDHNQSQLVADLRAIGASVVSLHRVGHGCPDLLIGYRERNILLEVKDARRPPSARLLTPEQQIWHRSWRGQAAVVMTLEEALGIVLA